MTDKKLLRIVKSFRYGILGRKDSDFMCLVVCWPLQKFLNYEYGMRTKLISGECHVGRFRPEHFWIELEDGRIIDPTYDQFGEFRPKVYIGEKPTQYIKSEYLKC